MGSINKHVCIGKNWNMCKTVTIKHEKSLLYLSWVMSREKNPSRCTWR